MIKGHTKIILTNVDSGEKSVYEHKNIVTEFADEYFRECGALNLNPLGSLQDAYPLDDLFGGIMVFQQPILQNTDDTGNHAKPLYLPAGNKMIGNGSIDFSSNSQVVELGQYNASLSSSSKNSRLYVYDWDVHEAIGEISCICLTTRAGGYIGAGNTHKNAQQIIPVDRTSLQRRIFAYPGTGSSARTIDQNTFLRVCAMDLTNAQIGLLSKDAVQAFTDGSVSVNWYDLPISKLNPFISKSEFSAFTTEGGQTVMVEPDRVTGPFTIGQQSVATARVMGGTGYILLVGVASGSFIQNGSTVYAKQINKDGTVTSFSATISGLSNAINLSWTNFNHYFIGGKIIDGALYLASGSQSGSGTTIRVKIASTGAAKDIGITDITDYSRMFVVNEGRISGAYSCYDPVNDEIYPLNSIDWCSYAAISYQCGIWNCYDCPLAFAVTMERLGTGYNFSWSPLIIFRPMCNWLSTINNLERTITKTDRQTMQIQYELILDQGNS